MDRWGDLDYGMAWHGRRAYSHCEWIFNVQASKLQGGGEATQAVASSADGSKGQVEDLFSAHDFDIQIDLPTSNEGIIVI